jgi:phosphoglycolate phosphatase-like HAD superfamily hydrolase
MKNSKTLEFSTLSKTWILDVDGTLVKHNGYKIDGYDTLLDGVSEFFNQLSPDDKVVLLTARKEEFLQELKEFLKANNIRYDYLLTDMPMGERILLNDRKPSGLDMAFAINKNRDEKLEIRYKINEEL